MVRGEWKCLVMGDRLLVTSSGIELAPDHPDHPLTTARIHPRRPEDVGDARRAVALPANSRMAAKRIRWRVSVTAAILLNDRSIGNRSEVRGVRCAAVRNGLERQKPS